MKVGKLNVWSICGLFDIVIGPNFCGMILCWLFVYALFGGVMLHNTIYLEWNRPTQIVLWSLLSINTFLFLKICFGPAGIPPVILQTLRAKDDRKVQTDAKVVDDPEANKERLLPTRKLNRICG